MVRVCEGNMAVRLSDFNVCIVHTIFYGYRECSCAYTEPVLIFPSRPMQVMRACTIMRDGRSDWIRWRF